MKALPSNFRLPAVTSDDRRTIAPRPSHSDLVRFGWQLVDERGWLQFKQKKTKGEVEIPLDTALPTGMRGLEHDHQNVRAALNATPRDQMLFIQTQQGRARSDKAFGAWFKARCHEAGLPEQLSLHGLRKYRAAQLAELGWSELKIGAWTGHQSLSEIVHYTRKANRRRMLEGPEQEQNSGNSHSAVSRIR